MNNQSVKKALVLSAIVCAGVSAGMAQKGKNAGVAPVMASPKDSGYKAGKPKLRAYKDVITAGAVSRKGMFTVHTIDDKYYFEIPFTLLQRDIMVINRIAEAAADMRMGRSTSGFSGDPIGAAIVRFEKGNGDKLYVRRYSYTEYSTDSTKPMYAAVQRNTLAPIVSAFPIVAFNKDSSAAVIEVTDYLNSDNDLFNFTDQMYKIMMHVGMQQNDKSYLKYVHVYPENIEVRSVKTYSISGSTRSGNYTVELNSSLMLLPEKPMKRRYYDDRVGYFTTDYMDYDANPQGVKQQQIANRWRLEPKPQDVEKYKRGELVEPQKPIVFYIDRATPKKWVPYLIQGVNDWQVAFEKAGFKNAIYARLAPTAEEDSTFSLEDARHAAIVYKPSDIPNASGPSIADPRSGEIMESHVNWYHNVMSLIHNWYMVQCGAVDPKACKMEFDDELMGQLIRFVSSHEIGHTLGLRHNFGSSSTVPVDSLRNKKWVEANGHTPSIMDYARFNYVAQPEDNISEAGLFPRIGDYDKWAIEWGYKWYDDTQTGEEEIPRLNKLVIERLQNKRLWFGTELSPTDYRSQNEDLGDDAVKAGEYGIKNLKRIVPNLLAWTSVPNEEYGNLAVIYKTLNGQLDRYLIHVAKIIGGLTETPKTVEQSGPVYAIVPKQRQKEAVAFLNRHAFVTPMWLYEKSIFDKTGQQFVGMIMERQGGLLNSLLGTYRLSRMIDQEATYGKGVYTLSEYLDDLSGDILKELYTHQPIDVYRRSLQKTYIDKLIGIAFPVENNNMIYRSGDAPDAPAAAVRQEMFPPKYCDIYSLMRYNLKTQLQLFKKALPLTNDLPTKAHIQDMIIRMEEAMARNK